MKRIVEYDVVFAENMATGLETPAELTQNIISSLAKTINEKIQDGWQPLGGVSVDSENAWLYQAVVRYEEE